MFIFELFLKRKKKKVLKILCNVRVHVDGIAIIRHFEGNFIIKTTRYDDEYEMGCAIGYISQHVFKKQNSCKRLTLIWNESRLKTWRADRFPNVNFSTRPIVLPLQHFDGAACNETRFSSASFWKRRCHIALPLVKNHVICLRKKGRCWHKALFSPPDEMYDDDDDGECRARVSFVNSNNDLSPPTFFFSLKKGKEREILFLNFVAPSACHRLLLFACGVINRMPTTTTMRNVRNEDVLLSASGSTKLREFLSRS